jgi:3-dehydroquinate synthase
MKNGSSIIHTLDIASSFESYCQTNQISHFVFLIDENTKQSCLPFFNHLNPIFINIKAGEANKTYQKLEYIIAQMSELGMQKNSVLINLGGGVISDIGGFAASIYQRGIRFINIPTTLMAMVDAAIGGKNGVDFNHLKNFIGVFNLPNAVLISPQFLKTLPQNEIESAWSEVIKMGIIYNQQLFNNIHNELDLYEIIKTCSNLKSEITLLDFRDQNIRQLLNFGHTIGHALESYYLSINQPILHGFAVAKGMLFEIDLAQKLNMISIEESKSMKLMIQTKVRVESINHNEFEGLKSFLIKDKKNINSNIVFSLPTGIGKGKWGIELSIESLNN